MNEDRRDEIIRTLARRVHELVMSNRRREYELLRLRNELNRLQRSPIPIRPLTPPADSDRISV